MVARDVGGVGGASQELSTLPEDTGRPNSSTIAALGLAQRAVDQTTPRLRWAIPRTHVPHTSRCRLQVARRGANDDDNISSDHHKAVGNLLCPWAPRASSHRQRASIHQPRIQSLLAKEWCDSYPGGSVSPIIERPGRESGPNL